MNSAPASIETPRLALRRPRAADADAIFRRYASDAEVGRYLAWPVHHALEDTHQFVAFSDGEWQRWPAGPYLIHARADGSLLGSTGLAFETPYRASTGYVLARDAWGQGYATEALLAMRQVAADLGVRRLYACCHKDHWPSRRVLEKGGFEFEGILRRHTGFPNLGSGEVQDVASYAWVGDAES